MAKSKPRIVFMGMNGIFSWIPFHALIEADQNVVGLIIPRQTADSEAPRRIEIPTYSPAESPTLLTLPNPSILQQAATYYIPILEVGSLKNPGSQNALQALQPDLICVACFPRLLPPAWLEVPSLGCLNLHPSLLPAYRGPAPLFWQFRSGEQRTGTTLHFMDKTTDTGNLVNQVEVPFPDGITGPEADRLTAEAGAQLLLKALAAPNRIPHSPQPTHGASYQPRPASEDRMLSTTWPARRAFNFIRGASGWGPFELQVDDVGIKVTEAIEFVEGMELGYAYRRDEKDTWVQFADGAVRVSFESAH